jgi:hypothetical protein
MIQPIYTWKTMATHTTRFAAYLLVLALPAHASAQHSTEDTLQARAFIETFYGFDFDSPSDHRRPDFLYNHARHNTFSINVALAELSYDGPRARGKVGLMAGTYAQDNYAHEPAALQNIAEAWVGARLGETLWLDAGVLPSHIGWESALTSQNLTLTRSLAAENSPFYLSGVRLCWTPSPSSSFALLAVNGWQNIAEPPGDSAKGLGTQWTWNPSEALSLNSSAWWSGETHLEGVRTRLFHDLYMIVRPSPSLQILAGFDLGAQTIQANADRWNTWWAAALIARYSLRSWLALALRVESFSDPHHIITAPTGDLSRHLSGASTNLDLRLSSAALFRLEARGLWHDQTLFTQRSDNSHTNLSVMASLALDISAPLSPGGE